MKKRFLPFLTLLMLATVSFAQTRTIEVTVPDTVETVYIAGTFNNWNPASDSMSLQSESPKVYSFDFESTDTLGGIQYKFLSGPDWKYEQKQAANFVYKFDSIAVVDTFNAVYHLDQADSVTIDVLVPVEVYELYLTGNFNGWDPSANKMEMVDSAADGKEFMITVYTMDTTTMEFKFIAGPGWAYEQTEAANYKYMDGNIIVLDAVEDFKAIYNPNDAGDIVLNITVPEGTPDVWIIGSFTDNWNPDSALQATQVNDSVWTVTVEDQANIEYKVYNYPDWAYEEASDDAGTSVSNRTASFLDGPSFDITVAFWKDVYQAPTGVKDIDDLVNRIYVTNKSIVVDDVKEKVTVFDIQGKIIQDVRTKGTFMSRALNTGVYIIRVDNKTKKVLVP